MTDRFGAARDVIAAAVEVRAFPGAVVEVGTSATVVWTEAFGRLSYADDAPPVTRDTIYDLASLTKVLATTSIAMRALDAGLVELGDPVARHLPRWRGAERAGVTLRHLLGHASGLTGYLPFWRDHRGRAEFEAAICDLPLEYPPGSQSIYSDLGFILLGFILSDRFGAPLDVLADRVFADVEAGPLRYLPPREWRPRTAPTTQDDWRGRLLVGEVDDRNAWALGGVAGHAGLFGSAAAVGTVARHVLGALAGNRTPLARPETVRLFAQKTVEVPRSSRALGWDTMLPTSSCGRRLSQVSIGHTGFTGTSLWIDPVRDLYVVFLTNRVHPTPENETILRVRPSLHDAIAEAFDLT